MQQSKQQRKLQWLPLSEIIKHYKHAVALVLLPLSGLWFYLLEAINTRPSYFMYSPLDDFIPFVKQMIIPYELWFLMIAVCLVYTLLRAPADFVSLCIYMYGMQMVVCLLFGLFPNGQDLRPTLHGNDVFTAAIAAIYSVDTPTNSAPSLHCTHSIACFIALWRGNFLTKWRKPILWGMGILCVSICLSTVMIKQHSIVDVIAAITLSYICYPLVYILRRKPVEDAPTTLPPIVKLVKAEAEA